MKNLRNLFKCNGKYGRKTKEDVVPVALNLHVDDSSYGKLQKTS